MVSTELASDFAQSPPSLLQLFKECNFKLLQEKFTTLASCNSLAEIISLVENINDEKPDEQTISNLEKKLSSTHDIKLSASQDHVINSQNFEHLYTFSVLKNAILNEGNVQVDVTEGERTQLRYDFKNYHTQIFGHFIIKANFNELAEIYTAIRWIHSGKPEEVIVRFRQSSVVLGQKVEYSYKPNRYNLISIGRTGKYDIILINGVPVYHFLSLTPFPTGITIDFIGSGDVACKSNIPLFMVTNFSPLFVKDGTYQDLNKIYLESSLHMNDWKVLSQLLNSFAVEDKHNLANTFEKIVAKVTNKLLHQGYKDYIIDSVLALMNDEQRESTIKKLPSLEPHPIVEVNNISVEISSNPSEQFSLSHLFFNRNKKIKLLDDICFRAYAGDVVGILGKNGAGKSTFLKTLVSSMPISEGSIFVDGKPILLRPGAGMQGDLTGRENILKTGLYMGYLPKELSLMMDDIISFAELEEHIDRPFRYYSDGMRARLIFALATAVPRDILLLDELLSAGDMGFQKKAMKRLDKFIQSSKLVFVVQHTFDFVLSKCTKCLLLENGKPVYYGDPKIATELYKESL